MLMNVFYATILCGLLSNIHCFWWGIQSQPPTTTPPPQPVVLKHMPLTYFRSYTYQPVQPFTYPFYPISSNGNIEGLQQQNLPITQGHLTRYEPFTGKYHFQSMEVPIVTKKFSRTTATATIIPTTSTTTTTTTPQPTTTTTTTTTTTPAPTTTTSTTTTTAPPPPPPPTSTTTTTSQSQYVPNSQFPHDSLSLTQRSSISGSPSILAHYNNEYPTYSRRLYPAPYNSPNFYRSNYPYPEYSLYNPQQQQQQQQQQLLLNTHGRSQIQLVPCMCPITVAGSGGGSGNSNSNGINTNTLDEDAQAKPVQPAYFSRTTPDEDDDMQLPPEKPRKVLIEKDIESIASLIPSSTSIPTTEMLRKTEEDNILLSYNKDFQNLETSNVLKDREEFNEDDNDNNEEE